MQPNNSLKLMRPTKSYLIKKQGKCTIVMAQISKKIMIIKKNLWNQLVAKRKLKGNV